MQTRTKVVVVVLIVAVAGFLTESNGPLGGFWRPAPDVPTAAGIQLALFMLLGVAEALALGMGVAFLLFGYSSLKGTFAISPALLRGAHLSISWLLMNWWAHDSFHLHNGMNLGGLLFIEYAFHVTLIIAGITLARFFVALVRGGGGTQASPA